MNKALKITLISLVSLLLAVALFVGGTSWYLYKNQKVVASYILGELNDMQKGYTTLDGLHITIVRTFPYISVDLENLALYASREDTLQPIYRFKDAYIGFDFWSVIKGTYDIKKIYLSEGQINVIRYEDGSLNLLLAKSPKQKAEEAAQSDTSHLHLHLKEIVLKDITINKTDLASQQVLSIHFTEAKTDFSYKDNLIDNHLNTRFEVLVWRIGESTFFRNKHLHWETDIHYDLDRDFLRIDPSRFEIEGGEFKVQGSVDLAKNAYLDLDITGEKPDFKLITSFAPEGVYETLQSYQNKGKIYFRGKVQGEAIDNTPKIDLEFGCENAEFINPRANNAIRNLDFTGFFTNGEKRTLETCELRIKSLSGDPEESTFRGSFHIKNFIDPYVSIDFHSKFNLATLQNFFEIDALEGLSGWLVIDMTIDELLDYNDVPTMLGKLKDGSDSRFVLKEVRYQGKNFHLPLRLDGEIDIENGSLVIKELQAKVGESDFLLKGDILNLATFLHGQDAEMQFDLLGKSKFLNLTQLLSFDKALAQAYNEEIRDLSFNLRFKTSSKYLRGYAGVPQGEFFVDEFNARFKNYAHALHDWHVDIVIDEKAFKIKQFEGMIDKSDFHLLGELRNYPALLDSTRSREAIESNLIFKTNYFSFDDLLTYKQHNYLPEEYSHEVLRNFILDMSLKIVPQDIFDGEYFRNMALSLRRLDGTFAVHNYGIRNVAGELTAQNNALRIRDLHAQVGKSDFRIDADIENIKKVMADDYSGKKTVSLQSNFLDLDEFLLASQGGSEKAAQAKTNAAKPDSNAHAEAYNIFAKPFPNIDIQAKIGTFHYGKYLLQQFKTTLRVLPNHYVYVDELDMLVAGGHMQLKGYFNGSNPQKIYFSSDIKAENIDLDKLFYKFDNFGQDYLVSENLHGKLSGTVRSKVHMHPDLVVDLGDTEAHVEAKVLNGRLTNFAPFKLMDKFMGSKDLDDVRFGELNNVLDVKNGHLHIPKMEISSTLGYLFISGNQNFDKDLKMNYEVEVPMFIIKEALWGYLFGKRKKENKAATEEVADAEIISSEERKSKKGVTVQVFGIPDNIDFKLGKKK